MGDLKQDELDFHQRLAQPGITSKLVIFHPDGNARLAHARFEASEGEYQSAPHLMINLCTAYVGRMSRRGTGPNLEGVLRPGSVAIALPDTQAEGYWSKTEMLGLAIDLSAYHDQVGDPFSIDRLIPAASTIHRDPLLTSVLTALWRDCEFHGMSSAFFDEGLGVVLRRLAEFQSYITTTVRSPDPLSGIALHTTLDLIESRLASDVSVAELACHVGMDVRTFSGAFKAALGCAPYAYLTQKRMDYAQDLLMTAIPITEIAFSVGYSNPSKFSAAFRKFTGKTPSEWRKSGI